MKKRNLIVLVIFGCLSMVNAVDTVNLEQHTQMKKKIEVEANSLDKLVISINIKLADAISQGEKTLKSLEDNLIFLKRIETDEDFRECVILKDGIERLHYSKSVADELLEEREITQKQHDDFVDKQTSRETVLTKNITKYCKK